MADLLSRKRQRAESCSDDEREEDASDAPLCQVCHRQPRKYCCPRCATLTCSLACCTAHKKARGCDGKRDVAAYAKAQTMGLRDLRQDCAFIESVERSQLPSNSKPAAAAEEPPVEEPALSSHEPQAARSAAS